MHELGIAQNILDIAIDTAQKEGAQKITRLDLVAGELRGIEPMQLTFCFTIVAKGSMAENAYLNIEQIPVSGHCNDCQSDFRIEDYAYLCPHCGSTRIQITGGTELRLKDIEIE